MLNSMLDSTRAPKAAEASTYPTLCPNLESRPNGNRLTEGNTNSKMAPHLARNALNLSADQAIHLSCPVGCPPFWVDRCFINHSWGRCNIRSPRHLDEGLILQNREENYFRAILDRHLLRWWCFIWFYMYPTALSFSLQWILPHLRNRWCSYLCQTSQRWSWEPHHVIHCFFFFMNESDRKPVEVNSMVNMRPYKQP
jgi:hypothetical protein